MDLECRLGASNSIAGRTGAIGLREGSGCFKEGDSTVSPSTRLALSEIFMLRTELRFFTADTGCFVVGETSSLVGERGMNECLKVDFAAFLKLIKEAVVGLKAECLNCARLGCGSSVD